MRFRVSLNSFGVKYRLGILVLLSITALLVVGFSGWVGISRVTRSLVTLEDERLPAAMLLDEIRTTSNLLVQYSYEVLTRETQAHAQSKFKQTLTRKEALAVVLARAMTDYDALPKSDDEKEAWTSLKESMQPWKVGNDELDSLVKAMVDNDDPDKQAELFANYKAPLANWGNTQSRVDLALTSLVALNKDNIDKAREEDAGRIALAMRFMLVTLGVAIAGLLVLAVIFVRSITGPVERLRQAIVGVAGSSDFTQRVEVRGNDEIAQTAGAFNRLLEGVQESLREVLDSAAAISTAAEHVLTASSQATHSSEDQSQSASSMAAAIEQMTVSITHIGESSHGTLARAREAGLAANQGVQSIEQTHAEIDRIARTVAQANTAIEALSRESERISSILQVIQEVAEQTNLLALNAAIEAARAGEQGRGFAVVADEVRKLAERTSASTREIGDLVVSMRASGGEAVQSMKSVNAQVDCSKTFSDSAVGHIARIRVSSEHVVGAVTDISEAISEQGATAQSIAQQVELVARLSETANSVAKETETISVDLERLSVALKSAVQRFHV